MVGSHDLSFGLNCTRGLYNIKLISQFLGHFDHCAGKVFHV